MSIQNILFDMGNVLLRFDRELFLDRWGAEGQDRKRLMEEVFLSVEWVQMDRGTLDEPEAEERMCARLPARLHPAVHGLTACWDDPILPVEGMEKLVKDLKRAGYGVYLLSNASHRQHIYWPRLPVSALFDGTLISADHGYMKPQPEIYRLALEVFGLTAEGCFFIDDVPANIEGGLQCGIRGTVFRGDVPRLRREMQEAGILI